MTTANFPVGSQVFVHWYGKTLQGEVVPDDHRVPLFASMLHVRIPVQGTPVVAVFTPAHVYATFDSVPVASPSPRAFPAGSPAGTPDVPLASLTVPTITPSCSTPALQEAWQRYTDFKNSHWDHERNRLQVSAQDEFMKLFRNYIAIKIGYHDPEASAPKEPPFVAVDPGHPDGDHSATIITDTETCEVLSELPKKATVPAASSADPIPKPTKKQLRSTGRIQYRDTIQTSIFD